jgi:hypothetical protein
MQCPISPHLNSSFVASGKWCTAFVWRVACPIGHTDRAACGKPWRGRAPALRLGSRITEETLGLIEWTVLGNELRLRPPPGTDLFAEHVHAGGKNDRLLHVSLEFERLCD